MDPKQDNLLGASVGTCGALVTFQIRLIAEPLPENGERSKTCYIDFLRDLTR